MIYYSGIVFGLILLFFIFSLLLESDMTIGPNDQRKEYPGNDVADTFDGPRSFTAGEVVAYLVDDSTSIATLTTDYTLNGLGGSKTVLVFNTPPATGYTLLILHIPLFGQATDITNLGRYLPEVVEAAMDKLAQQSAYLKAITDRALTFPLSAVLASYELPTPQALHYLRWNAANNQLENSLNLDTSSMTISGFMTTFLLSADDVEARANLYIGTFGGLDYDDISQTFIFNAGKLEFNLAEATPMANGINLPTSRYLKMQNSGAVQNDWIEGCDGEVAGTAGWYRTGKIFSWWHKVGTVSRKCVDWVLSATAGSSVFSFDGNIKRTIGTGGSAVSYDVGLLDCPLVTRNTNYAFVITDRGIGQKKTNTTAYNWTVEKTTLGANYDFPEGALIPILNIGTAGTVTIVQGTDVILKKAGSALTGNRTLPIDAQGYLYLVDKATNTWLVGGPGVG